MDWDRYFISEAYLAALKSKDTSTQVGAVIVGPDREIRSKGYNGPCRGEDDSDPALYVRPYKYSVFEHAERNAVYNAARIGVSTKGCTIYVTFHPCCDCARAIIQSGIAEVVMHKDFPGGQTWAQSQQEAADMLARCGVSTRWWSGVPVIREVLCSGKLHHFEKSQATTLPK